MAAYIWNTPSNSISASSNNKQDDKVINRIFVDPSIKRGIVLDEMSRPYNDRNTNKLDKKNTAGISYPIISINNNFLLPDEIVYMEISCEKFLPTINLEIQPKNENLLIKDPPKDGDIISVFIRTTTDVIVPLRCDFIIKTNTMTKANITNYQSSTKLILNGSLFIPGINLETSFASFGTSKDALKDIAKRLRIGFATNDINDTNDKQVWICPKTNIEKHIKEIENHSWKDEQSFYKTWIDIYYNLNYINVNESLMSSDTDIDMTAYSNTTDAQKLYPIDTNQDNAKEFPKLFNNVINETRNSPFYISSWKQYNESSKITNKVGSKINTYIFIHNQNLYNNLDSDPYTLLENNQMYDPKKIDSHIILRGRTTYDSNIASDSEMARENINTDDINTHNRWAGIQYTISDTESNDTNMWSGNVHINYNRAEHHNILNKKELDKMYIKIVVNGVCLQVMRGEKVPVLIKNTPSIISDTMLMESETNINKMFSGMYFVDGYKIIFKPEIYNSGAGYTNFSTEFILKRREWPAPVAIQKDVN